jgi:hypothetical protein
VFTIDSKTTALKFPSILLTPSCILVSLPEVPQPPTYLYQSISPAGLVVLLCLATLFVVVFVQPKPVMPGKLQSYLSFIYGSFLKPHTGDSNGNQQDALESFYQSQAAAYDTTRTTLLRGRDDMIELVAAQLKQKKFGRRPVWVDVSFVRSRNANATHSIEICRLVVALAGTLSKWTTIWMSPNSSVESISLI